MENDDQIACPVCNKIFEAIVIEKHVDKCLFLNSAADTTNAPKTNTLSASPGTAKRKFNDGFFASSKQEKAGTSREDGPQIKKEKKAFDFSTPLAKQLQPKSLEEFFGQNHIMGKNAVLRKLLENGEIPNMILWGPPGCGKTSLSSIIHEICKDNQQKYKFVSLCAATCGKNDVQTRIATAKGDLKFGRRTVMFMDEVHRFNKLQQDVFLLSVEKGEIILIGATTENPSFALNSALLSRCRVIVLQKLENEDLYQILKRCAETLNLAIIDPDNKASQSNNSDR